MLQLNLTTSPHYGLHSAVGKHHAQQSILPVRTACIAHLKLHTYVNLKHSLVSNGRRVRTHSQSPRPILESKSKPSHPLAYNRTRSPSTPAMQQDTETSSAGQPSPQAKLPTGTLIHKCPLNTDHPHRKTIRSTPSPFHFQVANPNDSLQGYSSGRKF